MGFTRINDGEPLIRYTMEVTKKIYRCEHPEEMGKAIEYYHGKAFINGEQDVEVTFIVYNLDSRVVKSRFLQLNSVKHNRVMHPYFYTAYDNRTVVCYDRIESFLSEEIRKLRVQAPVDGQPDEITACDIRELAMGLEEMHKNNFSFFDSQYPCRYVISKGKIKFCNIGLCAKEYTDDEKWDKRLNGEIKEFGTLITWLLDINVTWPEKESFLKCFSKLTRRSCRDLRVIYTHPFLMKDKKYAVQILEDACHALTSKDNDVRDYTSLRRYVFDKSFGVEFTGGKGWWHDQLSMNPKFLSTLSYGATNPNSIGTHTSGASLVSYPNNAGSPYVPSSSTSGTSSPFPAARTTRQPQKSFVNQTVSHRKNVKYSPTRLGDLLRFLRNVYQHYYEGPHKIRIAEVHDEIKKHWPTLIDTIHVASWT